MSESSLQFSIIEASEHIKKISADALLCSSNPDALNVKEKLKYDILCDDNYDKNIKPKEIPQINLRYNMKSFDYVRYLAQSSSC